MANPYTFEGSKYNPIVLPPGVQPNPNRDPLADFVKPDVPEVAPPDFSGGVPDAASVPAIREAGSEGVNAAQAEDQYTKDITPNFGGMPGPSGPTVLPGGVRMANLGVNGEEGERNYRGATDPSVVAEGINSESDAETQYGNQKANILGRLQQDQAHEYATLKERQQQRQMEIDAKQQAVEQATSRYTADLADRGQFWRNPGNIFAALATAMMPLGNTSAKDAMHMIDSAVQADWKQRKDLADTSLGHMKSNLAAYRQIAGDKDLGDTMALKHSYDVAQMELQRLSAQFQGPLAKAKAQQVIAELKMKSSLLAGELANKYLANKPEVMNKALAGAYQKEAKSGVKGAWSPLVGNRPEVSSTGGAGPGMTVPGGGPATGSISAPKPNDAMRLANGGRPTTVDKVVDNEPLYNIRNPGSKELVDTFKNQIAHEAIVAMGPNATSDRLARKAQEIIEKDKEMTSKVAGEAREKAANMKSWQNFSNDVNSVEAIARSSHQDPQEFLGDMRNLAPAKWALKINQLRDAYGSSNSPEARQFKANLEASERFHQVLAKQLINYYHGEGGSKMSDSVKDAFGQVISPASTWNQIKGFADGQSQSAAADWMSMAAQAGPRPAAILAIRYGVNNPRLNTKGVPERGK